MNKMDAEDAEFEIIDDNSHDTNSNEIKRVKMKPHFSGHHTVKISTTLVFIVAMIIALFLLPKVLSGAFILLAFVLKAGLALAGIAVIIFIVLNLIS